MHNLEINNELDAHLRGYAKRLDRDNGEDGYHDAVVSLLRQNTVPYNLIGLLKHKTKFAVFKVREHESTEYRNLEASYMGAKSSSDNLRPPTFQSKCRRGHDMAGDNLYWYKTRRVCKACRRIREKQ